MPQTKYALKVFNTSFIENRATALGGAIIARVGYQILVSVSVFLEFHGEVMLIENCLEMLSSNMNS